MSRIIIVLIVFYQKHMSPYKGFRCAYAALHHGDSCSMAIRKIIEVDGVVGGWRNIKRQFFLCSLAYDTLLKDKNNSEDKKKKRRWMERCDADPCQALNGIPKECCKGDGAVIFPAIAPPFEINLGQWCGCAVRTIPVLPSLNPRKV